MAISKTSLRGLAEIAAHEGIVQSPYRDSEGVGTIGGGHRASAGAPDPGAMSPGTVWPLADIMRLFARDIGKYETRVVDAVQVPVSQTEFDALVSFDYNTGGIHRARLTARLNAGDRTGAAEGFDGWHKPPAIIGRRNKEQALFRDGRYSGDGRATVYPADGRGNVEWSKGRRVDVLALLQGQPDDPGPEPESPPTRPQKPSEGGGTAGNPFSVVAGLIAGAVLWAARKPIGGLFRALFRGETRAEQVGGLIGIVLLAGAVTAMVFLVRW